MKSKDMYSIQDISAYMDLNINTLRYWLKKNADDCNNGIYDISLHSLFTKIRITKKYKHAIRVYEKYMTLDIDEFCTELKKYINYIKENRRKRRKNGNVYWTDSAIECYKNKSICTKCRYKEICFSIAIHIDDNIPPMKKAVKKLINDVGLPPKY